MEAKCRVGGRSILVHHDVGGSCKQVGVIGKSPVGEEEGTTIAQVGSQTTVRSVLLGPSGVDDLLPSLQETATHAPPRVQGGEMGDAENHLDVVVDFKRLGQSLEPVRRGGSALGSGQHIPFVGRGTHAQRQGKTHRTHAASTLRYGDEAQMGIEVLHLFYHPMGVVGAVHVDDNHLELTLIFLLQDEGKIVPQRVALLVSGDDNGDGGMGSARRRHVACLLHNLGEEQILPITQHRYSPEGEIGNEKYGFVLCHIL